MAVGYSMIFVLSIILSSVFTAGYTYIVLYKEETLKVKVAQTALRFAVTFICYVLIYFASVLALGAIYLAFDWDSGGETAFRVQFLTLTFWAASSSRLVASGCNKELPIWII